MKKVFKCRTQVTSYSDSILFTDDETKAAVIDPNFELASVKDLNDTFGEFGVFQGEVITKEGVFVYQESEFCDGSNCTCGYVSVESLTLAI